MKRILLIAFFISACGSKENAGISKLDFDLFTIETPGSWKAIKAKGIDSYVGKIAIDDSDTLYFDLGWYSNDLAEEPDFESKDGNIYVRNKKRSTVHEVFYDFLGVADTIDTSRFYKDTISWTIIDGRKAKLVKPKRSGEGTTGIYIDSLWEAGSDKDRFEMHGINLKPGNEKLFLEAIKTLKFTRGT